MNKLKRILSSLRDLARRYILTAWGRMRPRKVPCSRCGCDMRKAGVGLVERTAPVCVLDGNPPTLAYCPACTAVAADVDAKVKGLQALIASGGLPYELPRTQASDAAAAEIVEWKRLGFASKD